MRERERERERERDYFVTRIFFDLRSLCTIGGFIWCK